MPSNLTFFEDNEEQTSASNIVFAASIISSSQIMTIDQAMRSEEISTNYSLSEHPYTSFTQDTDFSIENQSKFKRIQSAPDLHSFNLSQR